MSRNILCIGSAPNRRLELFLKLLPFLKKKWNVDFIAVGRKEIKNKIINSKELGIKTFYYSGEVEHVDRDIRTLQTYDEDDYCLCH